MKTIRKKQSTKSGPELSIGETTTSACLSGCPNVNIDDDELMFELPMADGGQVPSCTPANVNWKKVLLGLKFEIQMAWSAILLALLFIPSHHLALRVPNFWNWVLTSLLVLAVLSPLLLWLLENERKYWFDLLVTSYFALVFNFALNLPILLAARIGSVFPLQDDHLAWLDQRMGIAIPAIQAWASVHLLGRLANASYGQLQHLMEAAILLPVLAGRATSSQRFLRSSLIAFAVGLPFFALLPAVGPWYGYHSLAAPSQLDCHALLLALRRPDAFELHEQAGIVCFPSFHVVWALLCVQALWTFRALRIPAVTLAGLILLSTLTTGEHYAMDVFGGILLAWFSGYLGNRLSNTEAVI